MGPWKRFSKSKLSLSGEGTYGSSSRSNDSDDDVLSPLNSDLQQTIHDQNQIIEIHQHTIEELKEEKELLQSQVWNFSDQLTQSRGEIDTRRTETGTLDKQLRSSRARVQVVEERIDEQSQELASQSNTIKTLSGHNQKLQNQVADLEALVSVAASDTGTGFRGLLTQYSELKRAHGKMALKLQSEEEMRLALDERLTEMQSENDSLKLAINELQKEASSLETCQPQTLRDLLTLRLVEQTWNEEKKDGTSGEPTQAQNWLPSGLSRKSFDEVCSPAEIQRLAKTFPKSRSFNQFYQQLKLTMCATCSKAKFSFKVDAHPTFKSMAWLNEYVGKNRYFSCCHEEVCKECFKKHLLATLETKWWYKLDTLQWFPCPRGACENALGIRCEADLETCLEQFCSNEAEQHVKTYIKALAFREALQTLEPKPSHDGLQKAAELHQTLLAASRMYSLFDPRFDPPLVDETGCIPEFVPGRIFNCVTDNEPSLIPLFLKFLRRRSRPKTCMVCSKSIFDIDYEDVESWKTSCVGFEGSWMWDVLVYPTSEIQQCNHDFEVCRACTAEHLRCSLISGGPSACENLSCPQCNRKLSYQEIRKLADTETVTKYEKFLLQTVLSNEPGFRWCLAPLCENGQLYQRDPVNPKISCEECSFQMCFTHEMPWHDGLTCAEYESQRDHGDPSFAETREWIRTNTKPCPNCQVGIQKGEACFHMTCSQCSHEFCWQCLAGWAEIRTQGQEGHTEGCFFRTNDVRPTGIRGENIEDALRARNAG